MKKRVIGGKKRRTLKNVAFIVGVSISVAVLPCLITSCGDDPLKPVSVSKTNEFTDQLIREKCSTCHTIDKVQDYEDDDWKEVVDKMIVYGAELTEEESANVIAYLKEGKSL